MSTNHSTGASTPGAIRPTIWSWPQLGRLAVVCVELVLLLAVVKVFSIENLAFFRLFVLAAAGFVVHAFLPLKLRMPFFVLLSFAGIVLVFGPRQGAWLVALGMMLIALAKLPVSFYLRLVLVLAAGGALALMRGGVWSHPWSAGIWPIFGAMFMFRMIVYLYDLKNNAAPTGWWRSAAYFFMLPNVLFPLFPVVDYKTFSRGCYKGDAIDTYQTGVEWIFRGLIQLILYRGVYQYLSVDPSDVGTAGGAALYFVYTYLLYLRISGSFHLVIGMMHLFGFNLPRTNYYYFLASSFTDYWRRINIYWKDFIQKIFFNPFYFRFNRRMNPTAALVLATLIAFFATWALHSYQWFWIRGTFPVIWQDIVFWSAMGLLVLANMIWETRRGRKRTLKKGNASLADSVGLALRTVGTFLVICASWAVWSAGSFDELSLMLARLMRPDAASALWIMGALASLGIAAVVVDRFDKRGGKKKGEAKGIRILGVPVPLSALKVSFVSAGLVVLVFAQIPFYYPPSVANVLGRLTNPSLLSARDTKTLERGYYEDLVDVSRFNPQLAEMFVERPPDWNRCWAEHRTGAFPAHELLPSREVMFKGAMFRTNRWKMRDREYERAKPDGTYRIVVSGASHTLGTGVEDDESYENVVEDRLNREVTPQSGVAYEILNMSVGGYGPYARLADLEERMVKFEPDALVIVGILDLYWASRDVIGAATGVYELPWPEPVEIARAAGVGEGMEWVVAEEALMGHREELLEWAFRRTVDLCRRHDVVPVAAFIGRPTPIGDDVRRDTEMQVAVARRAGFVVIDMLDAYDDAPDFSQLWIAKWDRHPNAAGHRILAESFYEGLTAALEIE